jgi:beta-galactosidase
MSSQLLPRIDHILHGGDYNPEQWTEDVWIEDIRLMRRAGVNFVSLGIFSWSRLQPSEGTYTFGWLDRVMDLLAANGIWVDLATATASPPPWMSVRYPDVLAVDADGRAYYPGSRQHYSPSSPTYRKFAAALVLKIARRYGKHPALAAWHINNEYACHLHACHSEASTEGFRAWLRKRYNSLDALNAAWGTAFWGQHYYAWREVLTPRRTPTFPNPGQTLDFQRFMNDTLLDLCRMERDILRKVTPDIPITTNLMGFFKPLNYWAWAPELDFASWDCYPDPLPGEEGGLVAARGHDLTRSLKPGRPFVLMEQATSHVNWRSVNATKPPGVMRLWSHQAVARGADGVLFFQWRQSVQGAEKYHGAMVQHAPAEKSRVYREVCELGAELKKLRPVVGSLIRSRIAIVVDWESWWAVEMPAKPMAFEYLLVAQQVHRYCFENNLPVDFVAPSTDLTGYRLVIAPTLYLLRKADADNLDRYVAAGGTLVATYFTGIVDENDRVLAGGFPAYLRQTLGLWVEEWFALGPGQSCEVRFTNGKKAVKGSRWTEAIHLEGARAVATFSDGYLKGRPAITRHRRERGNAFYLGTQLSDADLGGFLNTICKELELKPLLKATAGIEVTLRENGKRRFLFLLNHSDRSHRIKLGGLSGRELLSGTAVKESLTLPSLQVAVIELAHRGF